MHAVIAGSIAGLAATVPMTVVMKFLHHRLPAHEQYPLPPRQITRNVARKAHVEEALEPGPQWDAATYVNHFAYGSAVGAAYAAVGHHLPGPPAFRGILFGGIVWGGSYLGWLPLANILPPATREPAKRNALMIVAHVVWGATTGLAVEAMRGHGGYPSRPAGPT